MIIDGAETIAITAGDDKTIRVWNLPRGSSGKLTLNSTIYPPIGAGSTGRIYALAIDEAITLLAIGGYTGKSETGDHPVNLCEIITGRCTPALRGIFSSVSALSFKRGHPTLAIGTFSGEVIIYDFVKRTGGHIKEPDGHNITKLKFLSNGNLIVVNDFGNLYYFSSNGDLIKSLDLNSTVYSSQIWRTGRISSFSLTPDESIVAVGFSDAPVVMLFSIDASSILGLGVLTVDANLAPNASLGSVSWTKDGRYLLAAGDFQIADNSMRRLRANAPPNGSQRGIVRWQINRSATGSILRPETWIPEYMDGLPLFDTILDLHPFGASSVIGVTADPKLFIANKDGIISSITSSSQRDLRTTPTGYDLWWFRTNIDGTVLDIPKDEFRPQAPLNFDVASRKLIESDGPNRALSGPCFQFGRRDPREPHCPLIANYSVTDWLNSDVPIYSRTGAASKEILGDQSDDAVKSLAIAPNGSFFALGRRYTISVIDQFGNALTKPRVVEAEAWRVNITPDGRLLVAALGDGTIRWYSLEKGRELTELLALFISEPTPEFKTRRWVLWTPSGYYDASPGGEDLLGWHLNRGGDQSALFYPAGRFRDLYRRPDIIDQVLRTRRVPPPPPTEAFNTLIPPVLRILDVEQKGSAKVRVQYQLDWPLNSKRQVATLSGSVNGVTTRIGGAALSPDKDTGSIDLFVPAGSGPREISLSATTPEAGISEPAIRRTDNLKPTPGAGPGVLHALLVGVADYKDPAFRLTYAADDVKAIQAALARQKASGLYTNVRTTVLADAEATRGKILAAMREIAAAEGPNDTTILFLAGHGATQLAPRRIGAQSVDTMTYYFLPHDGVVRDGKVDPATAISQFDITLRFLGKIEGRKAVFLDTCRFGKTPGQGQRGLKVVYANEFERRLGSLLAATLGDKGWASVVYAASSDAEAALESSRFRNGHGAFTAALLDGLDGDPRLKRDAKGRFDQKQLGDWFELRVPEITGNQQAPVRADSSGPAFPLGSVVK